MEPHSALRTVFATLLAEVHAPQPNDPRLKLNQPLVSKKTLSRNVTVTGNVMETNVVVESVSLNGVRHVAAILLRETETERANGRVLTIRTEMFGLRDKLPAATDVRTVITDHVHVASKQPGRCEDVRTTTVDKNGVHRGTVGRYTTT